MPALQEILGQPADTIRNWLQQGKLDLSAIVYTGNPEPLFDTRAILKWLSRQRLI